MKLTLKPTVTAVLLAISGQGMTSSFEVIKRENTDVFEDKVISQNQLLKLSVAEFDPVFKQLILPELVGTELKSNQFGVVQFSQNAQEAVSIIEKAGGEIVGYLPEKTYITKWNNKIKSRITATKTFRFVGDYEHVYKLSPALWKTVDSENKNGLDSITIEVIGFKGTSAELLKKTVQKYNPEAVIVSSESIQDTPYLRLSLNSDVKQSVLDMVQFEQVMWVDQYLPVRIKNIDSVGPIQSDTAEITGATIWNKGITGTGQIVAVADSGLDRNQDFFSQYNTGTGGVSKQYTDAVNTSGTEPGELFPNNKVIGYFVQPGATPYDDNEECTDESGATGYHGTHVAGTVAGDAGTPASASSANYDNGDGMAPHAQILFQDIGNSQTGCLSGEGGYNMFVQAAKSGAGISSNSYGSTAVDSADDGYSFSDYQVDLASYDIEDMLIVFAAGNDGNAGIGHPGHAKNGLVVGALGHGNSTSTASFSGRGPAYDDRVKPDIMAPGIGIVSAAGNTDNAVPPTQSPTALSSKSGTSMATPTVAGGAALMRQYFMDGFYPDGSKSTSNQLKPSGALMKAVLLNGTKLRTRVPSIDQGWGRIYLDNNLYFAGDARDLRVWDLPNSNGLQTGDEMSFKVKVTPGEAFRATLSWFDPPASFGNGKALVNDLDLEVRFNGQVYKGNNWSLGESVAGGEADDIDTVEQIHIASPAAGEYEIVVKGTQVNGIGSTASRKQGFALATSQKHCASDVSTTASINLTESETGDPLLDIESSNGISNFQIYRKLGGCGVSNSEYNFIGQLNSHNNTNSFLDLGTDSGSTYGYAVRGVDACGEASYSECKSITSNAACATEPQFNTSSIQVSNTSSSSCGVDLQWSSAASQCANSGAVKYNIYRSDQAGFYPAIDNLLASAVSGSTYTDLTVGSNEKYHYIVTAIDELGNELIHQNSKSILTTGDNFDAGDFKEDPDSNSLALLDSPWQVTQRRASTGSKSYHNARDGFNYPANTCAFVTLPKIQIQSGARLSYDVQYKLEEFWDGVVVQISTNDGATWLDLPPSGGYPSVLSETEPTPGEPINACGFRKTQGAFSGVQNTFTTFNSDLSDYAGESVLIRWAFTSDPGSQEEGFYLDNINVSNASSPGVCEVSAINKNISGPWFNPAEDGHGFFLELLPGLNGAPDRMVSYWYTYLNGSPRWVFGNAPISGDSVSIEMVTTDGPMSPPNFNSEDLNLIPWGELTFNFDSELTGNISWNSQLEGFASGNMPINKIANISDSPKACLSGSYSNPSQSGHGFVIEVIGDVGSERVLISWYSYDNEGNQIWLLGQGDLVGDSATVPINIYSGTDFTPNFNSEDVISEYWGTLELDFSVKNKMTVGWETNYPGYENGELITDKFTLLKGKGCL